MIRLVLLILLFAAPLRAEVLVTPNEFQAMSEGRTLHFTQNGQPYGAEQFYVNRQSTWRYGDGSCTEGQWYMEGPAFCFVYDRTPVPQCWIFARRGADFYARVLGRAAGEASELRLSEISDRPIGCPAPGLGV